MNRNFSALRLVAVATLGALFVSHAGSAEASCFYPARRYGHYHRVVRTPVISFTLGSTRYDDRDYRVRRRGIFSDSYSGCYVKRPVRQIIVSQNEMSDAIFIVNVPNRNGSFTPVTLQPQRNGSYVGPRGEVYLAKPEMEQLKQMYGQ